MLGISFWRVVLGILRGLVLSGACLQVGMPSRYAAADHAPPNIVLLVADNLRYDLLGCAGNRIIQTPQIDELAAAGVRFENAYCTTSICAASRASILTGLYRRAHGYTFHRPPMTREQLASSYPALLKRAGYRTGFVGKFGIVAEEGATSAMFDVFQPAAAWGTDQPYVRRDENGDVKHLTRINGDRAVAFLRGCSEQQPFCLSVSFSAPHPEDDNPAQYVFDAQYAPLYSEAVIPPAPVAEQSYFERLPEFLQRSENRRRWFRRFDTPEKRQAMMKAMMRMITGVDAQVGRVMAALEQLGFAENTIVIFTSDNGLMVGEHVLTGICLIYEGSIRVPLIVYDPRCGARHGDRCLSEMALNVDIAPTLLTLAGVDVPSAMQGRSVVPLLSGATWGWRTDFFYEHLFVHPHIPQSEGVRNSRYVYARYLEQDPIYEQLFDLQRDAHQTNNLAGDADHRDLLGRLRDRCHQLRAEVTAVGRP